MLAMEVCQPHFLALEITCIIKHTPVVASTTPRPPTSQLTFDTESVTYSSGRNSNESHPDLRILHYNDVYHVEPGSREPVGGIARFQTLCNYYARDGRFEGQSELLTLFSGDAFNPSLESSVTKGLWRPVILWCLWAMIWIAGELWCQLETTG